MNNNYKKNEGIIIVSSSLHIDQIHFLLHKQDLGTLQTYWEKILKYIESMSDESESDISVFMDTLKKIEEIRWTSTSIDQNQIYLNLLISGYNAIQKKEKSSANYQAKYRYYYFLHFREQTPVAKKNALESALASLKNHDNEILEDLYSLGEILFRLRLFTKRKDARKNQLEELWQIIKRLWNTAYKSKTVSYMIKAIDLQGWSVSDTRLSLSFHDWWRNVKRLRSWLDLSSAEIHEDKDNLHKAIYHHWKGISAFHEYFTQMNKKGWQNAKTIQIEAIEQLRKAHEFVLQTQNTKWQAIIHGRLISKARPAGLGWKTYSSLGEQVKGVINRLEWIQDAYLLALGHIWISTYTYRTSWLTSDPKTQQNLLTTSRNHLQKATDILRKYSGPERIVYPYRRLSFIYSILMEKEQKDDQRKEYSKSALYFAKLALSASLKTDSESLKIAACSAIVNVRRLIVSTVEDPTTQHQHLLDAIQQVRSFLVLAKAIQQRNAYGYLKIDLGSLQTSLGEITNDPILLKQADDNFAEGITIFESQNETNILGRLYAARGRILSLNGAHSQAASKYQKAFQILKVQRPPRANYYRLWASIEKSKDLHISGKYHQASRELKTGIKAAIGFKEWKTEVKYWEAASRLEYSEFLVDQGRIQLACNWFEKARKAALALIKLLRKETISVYSRKLLIREEFLLLFIDLRIQIIKGRIFSKKGKHRLAVRHFQNSIQSIEKLSLMNTGKLLPDLLTQTEALCNLRYYIEDAYARKDVSGLETAKLYLSQNRNVLPPNIEPSIASLSHLLVVFVKCVDLFQTHPIKVKSRQVRDIQDEISGIAITLEKMKLVSIARHLAMILKLLDALNLVTRATRLERFNSKLDLIKQAEATLGEAYNEAKGIRNQTVLRRLSAIRKIAKRAIRTNTVFEFSVWDIIRQFPLIDIIQLHPSYDFRLDQPEDPVPILEQREYSEQIKEDKVIRFQTPEGKKIFQYLVNQFIKDSKSTMPQDALGYRSLPKIISECSISTMQIYGRYGVRKVGKRLIEAGWPLDRHPPGPPLKELLVNGLIRAKKFPNERGRKGSPIRIRVAIEKVPIKIYVQKYLENG